jgi:hypothetical protein
MCQLVNAEMAIERFRDGHLPHLRAARVRVTRILEKNVRQQVRGAFLAYSLTCHCNRVRG